MEKYIMYLRKSRYDADFESTSVEDTLLRQKQILSAFAKSKNMFVETILEEVVSGETLASRPMMMKVLDLINTGDYAGVVCNDIDRLSRGSSMESGYIMQVFKYSNCMIVTPSKTYDLSNDNDEQFTDMKFMMSRFEHKQITKRLVSGRRKSASEGRFIGSVPPFGYDSVKIPHQKGNVLKINEGQAEIVRIIFRMYAEGHGYNGVARYLNSMGVKPMMNDRWTATIIKNMIDNVTYNGKIRYGYDKLIRKVEDGHLIKKRKVCRNDYEVHEGLHEAIIDDELWERVKEVQNLKYPTSNRENNQLRNPFATIMVCGCCGRTVRTKRKGKADFERNPVTYLTCSNSFECKCRCTRTDIVEQAVVDEMRSLVDKYTIEVKNAPQTHMDDLRGVLEMTEKQIRQLEEQQEKICSLLETGVYTIEMFQKRNSAITAELNELRVKQSDLNNQIKDYKEPQFLPRSQKLLDNYEALTVEQKNMLWKEVLEKVTYYRDRETGEVTIHLYPRLA